MYHSVMIPKVVTFNLNNIQEKNLEIDSVIVKGVHFTTDFVVEVLLYGYASSLKLCETVFYI